MVSGFRSSHLRPVAYAQAVTLRLHILDTTLSIYEHCLIVSPVKQIPMDPSIQVQGVENLWSCLHAVKSWFDTFLNQDNIPLSQHTQISLAICAQMAHCLVALFRLSTFESLDIPWDRPRVLQELNFGELVKEWAERWANVPIAAGLDHDFNVESDDSPWAWSRKSLLVISNWWEVKIAPKIAAEAKKRTNIDPTAASDVFATTDQLQVDMMDFSEMGTDFMDNVWVQDVLGASYDFFNQPCL